MLILSLHECKPTVATVLWIWVLCLLTVQSRSSILVVWALLNFLVCSVFVCDLSITFAFALTYTIFLRCLDDDDSGKHLMNVLRSPMFSRALSNLTSGSILISMTMMRRTSLSPSCTRSCALSCYGGLSQTQKRCHQSTRQSCSQA